MKFKRATEKTLTRGLAQVKEGWLYQVAWREDRSAPGEQAPAGGMWLLFADAGGITAELRRRLEAQGHECLEVGWEGGADPAGAVRELVEQKRTLAGVAYLWGLEASAENQSRTLGGALELAKELASGAASGARLWLVTRGAQQVDGGDAVSVWQAPLWGLGRTVQSEHPNLGCRLVDLGEGGDAELTGLAALLASPGEENQVALRGTRRQAARLIAMPKARTGLPSSEPEAWSKITSEGTYLLTGGLGGLGLELARWLVAKGARHLVLVGRHEPGPATQAEIAKLEAVGAEVLVGQADVADRDQVAALVEDIRDTLPPLRGVAHLAGVLDDGVLAEQSWERFARVLAPKMQGARHLDELTRGMPLDFFVLYSSVASIFGGTGQANYAAANAFLDALAAKRRSEGLVGLSVSLGPVSEVGLAARGDRRLVENRLSRMGVGSLSVQESTEALEVLLARRVAHAAVVHLDAGRLTAGREGRTSGLLAELAGGKKAATPRGKQTPLVRELAGLTGTKRRERLVAFVCGVVADKLGMARPDQVELKRPLAEMGADSLLMVELRNSLSAGVGAKLPATLGFDYPTVETIAGYLDEKVLPGARATETVVAKPVVAGDPIAIVGMSCRFPGGCVTPEAYWQLLEGGVDAVDKVPRDRFDADALYDPDPDAPGKIYSRMGGFLQDADRFDPAFFGISPREAVALDPQHRMLLETAWEAIERAGIVPGTLMNSRTGAFVGVMSDDYAVLSGSKGLDALDGLSGSGTAYSMAAGRLSYVLGLQGPAMTLDTACSSSLVATHLACQALRNGECDLALAAGVTLIFMPIAYIQFSRMRGLSKSGRLSAFSDDADGTVWGEGCGMVVLERLSDAQRKGHPVLAVVRGTAVNHDGRSQGITAPNGPSQVRVMQAALAQAGVAPADIDYVEAHGTGTTLGDPIEANSVIEVYGRGRPAERPCLLGSVKSNFGHTQAAAGIASLMKVVLSLQHGRLPRSLHSEHPSRHVEWKDSGVKLVTEPVNWPAGEHTRRAAVSAFGFSGTNAHAILEEAPPIQPVIEARAEAARVEVLPYLVSGASEPAVPAQAKRLLEYVEANPEIELQDIAYSLAMDRTHFDRRIAVTAKDREELRTKLAVVARGEAPVGKKQGGRLAFLFTGQGSQRAGMGKELHAAHPVFKQALEECAGLLGAGLERPLLEVMFAEAGSEASALLDRTKYTQRALFAIEWALALFAIEWALAQLCGSWGVKPDVVVGHSIGEIVAACLAGVMSLEDACRLVVARSGLMEALPPGGAMVSVEADEAAVLPLLAGKEATVSIAGANAPTQTVISGEEGAVLGIAAELAKRGLRTKRLIVSHAFHSPLMAAMLAEFGKVVASIRLSRPRLALISNLTGKLAGDEVCTAEYWVRHVRETVRFAAGMRAMVESEGVRTCLELGPAPILSGLGQLCVGDKALFVASLRKGRPEWETAVGAAGELHAAGCEVDWQGFFAPVGGKRVLLPTYAFQRERYWMAAGPALVGGSGSVEHPLLGAGIVGPGSAVFEARWSSAQPPWVSDHRVHDLAIFPGPAYMGLVLEAARMAFGDGQLDLEDVVIQEALLFAESEQRRVQVIIHEVAADDIRFKVVSQSAAEGDQPDWTLHVSGQIRKGSGAAPAAPFRPEELKARLGTQVSGEDFYRIIGAGGIQYGGAFRGVQTVWTDKIGETLARIEMAPEIRGELGDYAFHPVAFDIVLHCGFAAALDQWSQAGAEPYVPIGFDRVRWFKRPSRGMWSYNSGPKAIFVDDDNEVVAEVSGIHVKQVPHDALARVGYRRLAPLIQELAWKERPDAGAERAGLKAPAEGWTCVLLSDGGAVGERLARLLAEKGCRAVVASWGERFERLGDGRYRIDPLSADDYGTLLAEVSPSGKAAAICNLWSVEERAPAEGAGAPDLEAESWRRVGPVLALARALANRDDGPSSWLVSRGAQAVGDDAVEPGQTLLWGLARTLRLEQRRTWGGIVDVGGADGADAQAAAILAALWSQGDDQLVFRAGRRYVPRLVRAQRVAWSMGTVRSDAAYLITGGLGGLGLEVADWLVKRGARHLALVGRNAPTETVRERVRALEAQGATVLVESADMARAEEVRALVERVGARLPPLRGVIHSAGVLDFKPLVDEGRADFWRVLAPKVSGGFHLMQATAGLELDFLVLFSSQAAVTGSAGQGAYGAANAYLDGLAHLLRARGVPGLSINWGVWGEVGMAARAEQDAEDVRATLRSQGIEALAPRKGISALEGLIGAGATQVMVAAMNWPRFVSSLEIAGAQPMLAELAGPAAAGAEGKAAPSGMIGKLAGMSEAERRAFLIERLRFEAATVLGMNKDDLNVDAGLLDQGFDSLLSLELRRRVEAGVGVKIPVATLMGRGSIMTIIEQLETSGVFGHKTAESQSPAQAATNISLAFLRSEEKAVAPFAIKPAEAGEIARSLDPQAVFLTGATGFVGAFLLEELLARTHAKVYCLVRARDDEHARRRLEEARDGLDIAAPLSDRVVAWSGALDRPRLGLADARWDELTREVDAVYHCGADVNLFDTYGALKPANVDGTLSAIAIATTGRTKALHYVSTAFLFAGHIEVDENDPLEKSEAASTGYPATKWVSEALIRRAMAQGLPARIYRPTWVEAHFQTGSYSHNNFLCRLYQTIVQAGAVPQLTQTINMVPVDYVARGLVALSLQPGPFGGTYHLAHPRPVSFGDVEAGVRQAGYDIGAVPEGKWLELVRATGPSPFFPDAEVAPGAVGIPLDLPTIRCAATIARLGELGISCPELDPAYHARWLLRMVARGVLPPPPMAVGSTRTTP